MAATFTLQEYIDEIRDDLTGYHYRDRPDYVITDGQNTLRFSSHLEEIRPESWDVLIEIRENDELFYSGFDPDEVLDRLCWLYGDCEFFEVVE